MIRLKCINLNDRIFDPWSFFIHLGELWVQDSYFCCSLTYVARESHDCQECFYWSTCQGWTSARFVQGILWPFGRILLTVRKLLFVHILNFRAIFLAEGQNTLLGNYMYQWKWFDSTSTCIDKTFLVNLAWFEFLQPRSRGLQNVSSLLFDVQSLH